MQSTVPGVNTSWEAQRTVKISQASRNIPRHWQWRLLIMCLIIGDALMIGIGFRLAHYILFETPISRSLLEAAGSFHLYRQFAFTTVPIWLAIFATNRLYNRQNLLGASKEYSLVFKATSTGMLLVFAVGFLLPGFNLHRGWLLLSWLLTFLFTTTGRLLLYRAVVHLREHGYYLSPAVIVGANDEGLSLAKQLIRWRSSGIHILGFLDKKLPAGKKVINHLYCLGSVDELEAIVERYGVEEIILATSAFSSRDKVLEIFRRYSNTNHVNVRISSGLYEIITTGLTVKDIAFVPLVRINPIRLTKVDRALKLVFDFSLALLSTIFIFPLILLIAIAIKLDSPGPIFSRQRIIGLNGKQFEAFKFRTEHSEEAVNLKAYPRLPAKPTSYQYYRNNPRLTRVGKWLLRTNLDELPKIFNVLKADISLIGPRPITPVEMDKYARWDMNLLSVRPGMTGLWQSFGRSDLSTSERIRLDMYYICNWSIWLDLQILFQSLLLAINGKGYY